MGIFDFLADIVTAPIEVAKDVLTLGGTLNDKEEPYTVKRLEQILEDLEDEE